MINNRIASLEARLARLERLASSYVNPYPRELLPFIELVFAGLRKHGFLLSSSDAKILASELLLEGVGHKDLPEGMTVDIKIKPQGKYGRIGFVTNKSSMSYSVYINTNELFTFIDPIDDETFTAKEAVENFVDAMDILVKNVRFEEGLPPVRSLITGEYPPIEFNPNNRWHKALGKDNKIFIQEKKPIVFNPNNRFHRALGRDNKIFIQEE